MKKLSGFGVPAVCVVCVAALVAVMASTAAAQSADELIAKNIKAQGGRDALLGLKALERKGDVNLDGSFGQMEGTVEEVLIPWKKARRSLDLAVFVQDEGYDGEVAWRDGMMGLQELEGQEASQIKQSVELNPFVMIGENGSKAEKLDDETVDDVEYNVVELTPKEGPTIKFFLDKESSLIKRTSLTQDNPQFGEIEITVKTDDYKEYGPIKLSTKDTVTLGDIFEIETTYTETKINGEVDEAIFMMPKEDAAE
jgi:hypothetical protein